MIKIGFIVPTWHYFIDPFKLQPILELYFATFVEQTFSSQDVEMSVIDLRNMRVDGRTFDIDAVSDYVPKKDLYFYWIMKAADYPEAVQIAEHLRTLYPGSKHATGGTHIEYYFEDAQKHFDSAISGPGEDPFEDIVNRHLNGEPLLPSYRNHWNTSGYDDRPIAKREFLPRESIVNRTLFQKYGEVPGTSVLLQRGCNYNCTYCVYNVPNTIQRREPPTIEREINYLKANYGVEGINLRDEVAIPYKDEIAIPFLEAIGNCDVIWRGQTRVGPSRDIIKLAADTGCVELSVGVETASPLVLELIKKGQTFDMVRDFITYAHEFDIRVKMCLILGLPGEPQDILEVTKSYIEQTKPDYVAVSGFCPVPGSRIYKNAEYYGIKNIDDDMNKHAHLMLRFDDEEEFGLPFEYEEENKWGKTLSRETILANVKELQYFCREKGMLY